MNNGAHLLIIEDNPDVRENLAEILELHGYRVTTAEHGLAGVRAAFAEVPDLILCDVMMPELDGFGVLNLIMENEATATVPFVFITAKTEKIDIRRGMNLGADDYITKPFYKDELLQVIQTRLKKAVRRTTTTPPDDGPHLSDPARGWATLVEAFADQEQSQTYDGGQIIVRADTRAHFLYRVEKGSVLLSRTHAYGRDYILAEKGPGEMFGIPAALEQTAHCYTARAAVDGTVCQLLPTSALLALINRDRTVAEAVLHELAVRVVDQEDRLVHQAYDSVRRRTALVLCDLVEKYGGDAITLSREELAQMVGTTKESVIRALSDFKRDKLITTDGRQVQVVAPTALRNLLV